jgi:hypothetical protein
MSRRVACGAPFSSLQTIANVSVRFVFGTRGRATGTLVATPVQFADAVDFLGKVGCFPERARYARSTRCASSIASRIGMPCGHAPRHGAGQPTQTLAFFASAA